MCERGICADGYALYAVFENGSGKKTIQLEATTLSDAEQETKKICSDFDRLLYIESRHVTEPAH